MYGSSSQWACGCEQKHGHKTKFCSKHPRKIMVKDFDWKARFWSGEYKRLCKILANQLHVDDVYVGTDSNIYLVRRNQSVHTKFSKQA